MLTLHLNALNEPNPIAVKREPSRTTSETRFPTEALTGKWLRVFPKTARDVIYLRSTEHQLDRFAPSTGQGVLLAARCLPAGLDARMQ